MKKSERNKLNRMRPRHKLTIGAHTPAVIVESLVKNRTSTLDKTFLVRLEDESRDQFSVLADKLDIGVGSLARLLIDCANAVGPAGVIDFINAANRERQSLEEGLRASDEGGEK